MIKISTLYVYIKKVYHYNKWSLKINLFTKVFIKRSVLIFGRTQPFSLRLCTYVFWTGMISFSGWQSVDINFFKMFWSCLFKRFLVKTGNEIKLRLWHRSKKFCITVRSDSDAP